MAKQKKLAELPKMKFTERDVSLILFLLKVRFLRREQIERLHFTKNDLLSPTSKAKANRRLKKLLAHDFVDRIEKPVSSGKPQAVYTLGKNGFDFLTEILEKDKSQLVFRKKPKKVEFLFLDHCLGISEFRVSLELALRKTASLGLLFWFYESNELNTRVAHPRIRDEYLPIRPDAFFGLRTPQGRSYFFLEIDMATQDHKRIEKKILAYKQYWKSGLYKKEYGFNSLRVLTVTTSERRLQSLISTARSANAKNMFLFATLPDISDGKIFGPIWKSTQEDNISII